MNWMVRNKNGEIVDFDRQELEESIITAVHTSEEEVDIDEIVLQVEDILHEKFFIDGSIPGTAKIKTLLARILLENGYFLTSDVVSGRYAPHQNNNLVQGLVEDYVSRNDWRVNENSNMNYSMQGLNNHISSAVIARYWLDKFYDSEIKEAQNNGDLHIHDLGVLGPYCVGWDLQELINSGFGGVKNKVESSPARHFRTILGQIVNFFYTLQGEAAGAQAFSNFDTLLAPFIYQDQLGYKEVKQALQEFIFNLNVPTRVGFQAPFTNITLDLTPSSVLKEVPVVIGGEIIPGKTYGDFPKEMIMINRAIAELMTQGDKKGRIFTFPIPTYNIHQDFDFDNENLKPIWEMTGKYGIPYFSNFVNSNISPKDVRSMCCRLRLDTKELRSRGGGLFGANPQTGSIGVVTVNIPRLAYLATNDRDFYKRLDYQLELAKRSLEIKRKQIEQYTDQGLYPYTSVYLKNVKQRFGTWWANHFSTIGIIGMNEACQNFLNRPITDNAAREWVQNVMGYIREKLQFFQEETGNYYNLEATPAEGASYRLAKKDKEKFKKNFAQGDDAVPYYTNSVHVPAVEEMDIFELLEHQDELQTLFTGGTVVHLYLGEAIHDYTAVKELVKAVVHRFKLPYFSITPTFSVCPIHGYISGKHFHCPYPHSDEDIKKFGTEKEMEKKELAELEDSAFRYVDKKLNEREGQIHEY
ncbi:MAG: ribonucleoside triphosphate reductase [Myxococcota bacterium]